MLRGKTNIGTLCLVASWMVMGCFTENTPISEDDSVAATTSSESSSAGEPTTNSESRDTGPSDSTVVTESQDDSSTEDPCDSGSGSASETHDDSESLSEEENSGSVEPDTGSVEPDTGSVEPDTPAADTESLSEDSDTPREDTGSDPEPECPSFTYTACGADGHVHSFDSCDADGGVVEQCSANAVCEDLEAQPAAAGCRCTGHWTGEQCDACPGHWDAAQDCNACVTHWTGGNCEACPANWDPGQDCNACANQWTGAACDVCPSHFDPASNCSSCAAGWAEAGCNTCVRYADASSGASSPTGLSWTSAFGQVRDAIDSAAWAIADGTAATCEVWVASGTYYNYVSSVDDTVILRDSVDLYGGFAGGETTKTNRNPSTYRAVLSGLQSSGSSNAVCHVLSASGGAEMIVDGFTILDGVSTNESCAISSGGGAYVKNAQVSFVDCTFRDNQAYYGGALQIEGTAAVTMSGCMATNNFSINNGAVVHVYNGASLQVTNCVFARNLTSLFSDSANGGAIFGGVNTSLMVEDSVFDGNFATGRGAAIAVRSPAAATIDRSVFVDHRGGDGGTLAISDSGTLLVRSSLFVGSSGFSTSAVGVTYGAVLQLANCTVAEVERSSGLPVFRSDNADSGSTKGALRLSNCVVWTPGNPLFTIASGATTTVAYTDASDGPPSGTGNKSQNPLFAGQPESSGYWKSSSYSSATGMSTFTKTDGEPDWVSGELEGALIMLDTTNRYRAVVRGNTTRGLTVVGQIGSVNNAGKSYAVYDYRLGSGSPCIDTGTSSDPNLPLTDLEGTIFADVPGIGTSGAKHDMGAYEYAN